MQLRNLALSIVPATVLSLASGAFGVVFISFEPASSQNTTVVFGPPNPANSRTVTPGATSNTLTLRSFIPVPGQGGVAFPGGTEFDNVQVVLTGLVVKGPAASVGSLLAQSLAEATFSFVDTDTQKVLLSGNLHDTIFVDDGEGGVTPIDANVLSGLRGSQTGGINFANVDYTGGVIYDALIQIPGVVATPGLRVPVAGSGVFNLLLPNTQTFGLSGGSIRSFDARAQGQFLTPVIPESSTLFGAMGAVSMLVMRRRAHA